MQMIKEPDNKPKYSSIPDDNHPSESVQAATAEHYKGSTADQSNEHLGFNPEPNPHRLLTTAMNSIGRICLVVLAICIGISVGVVIGWYSSKARYDIVAPGWSDALREEDADVHEMLMEEIKAANIKEYLRKFTSSPHLAGTAADKETADYIRDEWISYGLDPVRQNAYNVLLSYPNEDSPNIVSILNSDNSVYFQSQASEAPLNGEPTNEDVVRPFNAYAASGVIEGDLVYVNYGRVEDFQMLERNLGINVTSKIAIARYGRIFRGDKVIQAEAFGAIGLILYSDPADYAADGATSVYPNSWWLPGSGVQRGSTFIRGVGGDPLTPGYPSLASAYYEDESTVGLPTIPAQPIGYDDAKVILENLAGDPAPDDWQGALGITYRLGPSIQMSRKVKLEVYNRNEMRTTYNVIGLIKGSIEPDRYVILGNHHDAWVYGSVDPSSGTSLLMELSRSMGLLYKTGKFRPRRSIVFCSWGAEEYSLIGSTEWVEEFTKTLGERAVAYLNVDLSLQGNYTFRAKSTPNLFGAIYDATKAVQDAPFPGHLDSVYDTWADRRPWSDDNPLPYIQNLGSGSDFASFLGEIGISAVDLRYDYDQKLGISSYPLYHSMYETFYLMSEIMDPSFEYHLAIGRVWGELARSLADSLILPFDCRTYVDHLSTSIDVLKEDYSAQMAPEGINFADIDASLASLKTAANELHEFIDNMDMTNPFTVRQVNDQLMYMDRAFTDPLGLPGRPLQRHVAFAPSSKNSYYGDAFPGIVDLMFDIENSPDPDAQWEEVRKHMSVIAFILHSVATTLTDVNVLGVQP